MIYISRLNGEKVALNDDLIELMEETPDTVITLTTGKKMVASESIDDIIERIADFRRKCFQVISS
ncbi:MAG: flagellar FlbD family protein [Syntrophomonadaceae bacterium]|jgi:flagellar protein FlbD|nr:flagellar FlbD family protein [Syntrophomonadaceae bacterium]